MTLTEPGYPRLLREIPDPPPFLYVHGRLEGDAAKLAVVGSRHATGYGLTTTASLCESLTAYNLTIVSGMARGIDTAAHEGALAAWAAAWSEFIHWKTGNYFTGLLKMVPLSRNFP